MLTVPVVVELVVAENVNSVLQITDEDGEEKVKPILKSLFTDIMSAGKERVAGAWNNKGPTKVTSKFDSVKEGNKILK